MDAAHHDSWRIVTPLLSNHFHSNFYYVGSNFGNPSGFFLNDPFLVMLPYYDQYHYPSWCFASQSSTASGIGRPLPPQDPELYPKILKQIEYYFSKENLVRDTYLRKQMEEYGWVDVEVIAKFRKIKELTDNRYHILEALVSSSVVQVRGYKMRVRSGWKRWIIPSDFKVPACRSNNNNVKV